MARGEGNGDLLYSARIILAASDSRACIQTGFAKRHAAAIKQIVTTAEKTTGAIKK